MAIMAEAGGGGMDGDSDRQQSKGSHPGDRREALRPTQNKRLVEYRGQKQRGRQANKRTRHNAKRRRK